MKETFETTETVIRYHHQYSCSRCEKPCGPSEKNTFFQIAEASIQMEEGSAYPEGGSKEETIIDCCVQCFQDFAIPALEMAGFKTRIEEKAW